MGNRDYYLDPENEHIRKATRSIWQDIPFCGHSEADVEKAVAGVMNVEMKLAEKSWSNVELRNIPRSTTPRRRPISRRFTTP